MHRHFFIPFLLLVLALFLQIFLGNATGVWISFALAALVASAFFVEPAELAILILCAVLVLNWQPSLSWELVAFACLPFAAFALYRSRIIPFKPWLVNAIAVFSCIVVLYAIFGIRLFASEPRVVFSDIAASLFSGMAFFAVASYARTVEADSMLR